MYAFMCMLTKSRHELESMVFAANWNQVMWNCVEVNQKRKNEVVCLSVQTIENEATRVTRNLYAFLFCSPGDDQLRDLVRGTLSPNSQRCSHPHKILLRYVIPVTFACADPSKPLSLYALAVSALGTPLRLSC